MSEAGIMTLAMTAAHRQQLTEIQTEFTSVPLTKQDSLESKLAIAELEIGRMIPPTTLVMKRLEGLKAPTGGSFEVRRKLFKAYMGLEQTVCPPRDFEDNIDNFEEMVLEQLNRLKSRTLSKAFALLQVELKLLACVQYFRRTEDGLAEDDLDAASARFREALKRLVLPFFSRADEPDEQIVAINARVDEATKTAKTDKMIFDFIHAFDDQGLRDCLKQLLVEVQDRLFGPPRLCARSVDASLLEAAARTRGVMDFSKVSQQRTVLPPTPARALNRATKALNEAAGRDPLSQLRQNRRAPSVRELSESSEEEEEVEEKAPTPAKAQPTETVSQPPPSSSKKRVTAPQTPSSAAKRQQQAPAPTSRTPTAAAVAVASQAGAPSSLEKPKRVGFTPEEDEALRVGVEQYGEGKWKDILNDHKLGRIFEKNGRTNVGLKDRWRNLKVLQKNA